MYLSFEGSIEETVSKSIFLSCKETEQLKLVLWRLLGI